MMGVSSTRSMDFFCYRLQFKSLGSVDEKMNSSENKTEKKSKPWNEIVFQILE